MARQLTQLPKTAFSGLDYDNIISDVTNLVQDNPDYNIEWDNFLSSDAGRMLIEIFAYITDQLASRIDWVVNENFITTATQKRSIIRLLKIIGYNFTLPIAASVAVNVTTTGYPGPYYLTSAYDALEGTFSPFSLTANNTLGVSTTFELLTYDAEKYEYKQGVKIDSETDEITFYEGKTYVETFTANTDNGYSFTLSNFPVIENSVRIYFVNGPVEEEMLEVTSFLNPEAQAEDDGEGTDYGIPFALEVNEDESVTVESGTTAILTNSNRRLSTNDVVKVFYRTGGGTTGNISSQAIRTSRSLSVDVVAGGNAIVQVAFLNDNQGTGGINGETADHAATYAPLQLRTVNKAVNAEDYDTLLNANDSIITARVYGNSNAPSTVFSEYGVYLNPFDVWIYALPNTSDWEAYTASRYNDIDWISLRLENMFNNYHLFRTGYFNSGDSYINSSDVQGKTLFGDTIDNDGTGDSQFKNYIIIDPPTIFKDGFFENSDTRVRITTTPSTNSSFENLTDIVVGELSIGSGVGDTVIMLQGDTYASFQSLVNIEGGVNFGDSGNYIRINIDNLGDTSIDISNGAIDVSSVKPHEIAAAINLKLALSVLYGGVYGDSITGKTGVASVISPDDSTSYMKLTSPITGDSSVIYFVNNAILAGDSDATADVFGSIVAGDTYANWGYERLTLVINSTESTYKQVLYEHGSINLANDPDAFYFHYLLSEGDTIQLGDYWYDNYGAASPSDPLWRGQAARIYNTAEYGDTGDSVDIYNSDFDLRFTGDTTDSLSIYNITSDWNVAQASVPKLMSSSYITNDLDGDTTANLDSSAYAITINIDGLGDTTIDITNDLGVSGDTYGYPIQDIVDNINTHLRNAFGVGYSAGAPYDTFNFAARGDTYPNRIVIKSPTATNNSFIAIKPSGDTNYAAEELNFLGSGDSLGYGDSHYWYPQGDYYLWYNVTRNAMDLMKLNNTRMNVGDTPAVSNMPDGGFYTHFVWDRRNTAGLGENTYQTFLQNAKIIGVENIFKETRFTTFYATGTVFYDENFSQAVIKDTVESVITEEFSFVNSSNIVKRDYGQSLSRSQVLKTMLDVDGIKYVELSYFGPDSSDSSTNEVNTIDCEFDEIVCLHESGISFTYTLFEE